MVKDEEDFEYRLEYPGVAERCLSLALNGTFDITNMELRSKDIDLQRLRYDQQERVIADWNKDLEQYGCACSIKQPIYGLEVVVVKIKTFGKMEDIVMDRRSRQERFSPRTVKVRPGTSTPI